MAIKYCIWDVGKVIYGYSLRPLKHLLYGLTLNLEACRQKNFSFCFDDYMKGAYGFSELCHRLCDFYFVPWTPQTEEQIRQAFFDGIGEFYPETKKLQQTMLSHGIQNCILSNALPILSDSVSIPSICPEHIFCSFELGLLKPDPQIFHAVRHRLGCRFNEIVFIDDKEKNTAAATALGIFPITFDRWTIEEKLLNLTKDQNLSSEKS